MLNAFTLAGHVYNLEVEDLELRLYLQYGPWNAVWRSPATTTRVMLHSDNGVAVQGANGMYNLTFPLNYTAPTDGYMAMAMRPGSTSTLTGTQFIYVTSALDITLPPSG